MIVEPFAAAAVQVAVIWLSPRVAVTDAGGDGVPRIKIGLDATDGDDVPFAFVAVTVNVYVVPAVSPVMVQVRAPVLVQVFASGVEVAVYSVIGEPPLFAGAAHVMTAWRLPAVAVTDVGDPGAVAVLRTPIW